MQRKVVRFPEIPVKNNEEKGTPDALTEVVHLLIKLRLDALKEGYREGYEAGIKSGAYISFLKE